MSIQMEAIGVIGLRVSFHLNTNIYKEIFTCISVSLKEIKEKYYIHNEKSIVS